MRFRILITVGAVALIGATFLFGARAPAPTGDPFPDRSQTRIELPEAEKGRDQIETEFYPGTSTPKKSTIHFKSGEIGYDYHRADGTLERREIFYPADEAGFRQLKLEASIATDGKTYVKDAGYHEDGSEARLGIRGPDGSYAVTLFFAGPGKRVEREWLEDGKGKLVMQRVYFADGLLAEEARWNNSAFEVTGYSPEGKRILTRVMLSYSDRLIEYYPDGETVKHDFHMESYRTTAVYHDEDGVITQKRTFVSYQMTAIIYKDGVPAYKQVWSLRTGKDAKPGVNEYDLSGLALLDAEGKETWTAHITLKTGKPWFINYGFDRSDPEALETIRVFYDDGCLKRIRTRKGGKGSFSDEEFANVPCVNDEALDVIPVHLLADVPYVVPPRPVPPPEPSEH